jgi:hypothetical protein
VEEFESMDQSLAGDKTGQVGLCFVTGVVVGEMPCFVGSRAVYMCSPSLRDFIPCRSADANKFFVIHNFGQDLWPAGCRANLVQSNCVARK